MAAKKGVPHERRSRSVYLEPRGSSGSEDIVLGFSNERAYTPTIELVFPNI